MEHISESSDCDEWEEETTSSFPCKIELSCFMGSYQNYHVRVGDTLVKIADNCPIGKKVFNVGDDAYISFRSECSHLLET